MTENTEKTSGKCQTHDEGKRCDIAARRENAEYAGEEEIVAHTHVVGISSGSAALFASDGTDEEDTDDVDACNADADAGAEVDTEAEAEAEAEANADADTEAAAEAAAGASLAAMRNVK